jgi:hypothetical protein
MYYQTIKDQMYYELLKDPNLILDRDLTEKELSNMIQGGLLTVIKRVNPILTSDMYYMSNPAATFDYSKLFMFLNGYYKKCAN